MTLLICTLEIVYHDPYLSVSVKGLECIPTLQEQSFIIEKRCRDRNIFRQEIK